MRILFKVYPQKSHLNATFPLAKALCREGHEVVYAGIGALQQHVEAQGLRYHIQTVDIFPHVEPKKSDPKLTTVAMLWKAWRHRKWAQGSKARYARMAGFDRLVGDLKPDLVLVDSPYTFFALGLFRLGVPFALIESMVNLDRLPGFPPQDTAYVPDGRWLDHCWAAAHWRRYFVKRWLMGAMGVRLDFRHRFVLDTARRTGVRPNVVCFDRYFHIGLRTVPEFILSPREFDFPRAPAKNQYYVGPSVDVHREESASDYRFAARFERLVTARKDGKPLVYCSLGTGAWRYEGAEVFLARVIAAARGANWNLVLATGSELEIPNAGERPENVEVFQVVPQIQVLQWADVMITHGGMNSITECILAGVPMVVFPGTTQIDQAGNAARVAWHQLGLKGSMTRDSSTRIRSYVDRVLAGEQYKRRAREMGAHIRNSEAFTSGTRVLFRAVERYFPGFIPADQSAKATTPEIQSTTAGMRAVTVTQEISS